MERDRAGLEAKFPGVDAWTGVRSFDEIAAIVSGRPVSVPDRTFLYSDASPRLVSTPGTWAYVKISEGCSHRCAFCAIPLIKGRYVSRSPASIVREARALAGLGVREIDLISHDTTWFGRDRGVRDGLAGLLERLARVPGIAWIRFLYGYPEEITGRLLDAMAGPKICRYFDIPFQHADPGLLKAMKRGLDGARALRLLERIRTQAPGRGRQDLAHRRLPRRRQKGIRGPAPLRPRGPLRPPGRLRLLAGERDGRLRPSGHRLPRRKGGAAPGDHGPPGRDLAGA